MAAKGSNTGRRPGGKARTVLNDPELVVLMRLVEGGRFADI